MASKLTIEQQIAQHQDEINRLKKLAQENEKDSFYLLGKLYFNACLEDDIKAMNALTMIGKLKESERKKLSVLIEKLRQVKRPQPTQPVQPCQLLEI